MVSGHVSLFAREGVLVEPGAIDQLERVANLPGCVRAVGMPDIHPGPGMPVGAVFAFDKVLRPSLIGSDAGCGVRAVALPSRIPSLDRMERRLRREFAAPCLPNVAPGLLGQVAWRCGVSGLVDLPGIPQSLRELALSDTDHDALPASADSPADLETHALSLGTIGGGNHFAEIARVASIEDAEAAARLGLRRGSHVLLVHSGTRGLGQALADDWGPGAIPEENALPCVAQIAGAVRFARVNRFLLAHRVLQAIGARGDGGGMPALDLVHNDLRRATLDGRPVWLHRKGAAPAEEGRLTVVLGSRGAPSWLMLGTVSERGLFSVAHGAGRRMSRSEARERFRLRHTRMSLARTASGGRVIGGETTALYEEHPDAYKPIAPVVRSLVEAGLASHVAALEPVVTLKQ